jgi:hypothetical protein
MSNQLRTIRRLRDLARRARRRMSLLISNVAAQKQMQYCADWFEARADAADAIERAREATKRELLDQRAAAGRETRATEMELVAQVKPMPTKHTS